MTGLLFRLYRLPNNRYYRNIFERHSKESAFFNYICIAVFDVLTGKNSIDILLIIK